MSPETFDDYRIFVLKYRADRRVIKPECPARRWIRPTRPALHDRYCPVNDYYESNRTRAIILLQARVKISELSCLGYFYNGILIKTTDTVEDSNKNDLQLWPGVGRFTRAPGTERVRIKRGCSGHSGRDAYGTGPGQLVGHREVTVGGHTGTLLLERRGAG